MWQRKWAREIALPCPFRSGVSILWVLTTLKHFQYSCKTGIVLSHLGGKNKYTAKMGHQSLQQLKITLAVPCWTTAYYCANNINSWFVAPTPLHDHWVI
jgi:hypothetical protein